MIETLVGTIINLWEGTGAGDEEGRTTRSIGYFLTRVEAEEAVKKEFGVMGNPVKNVQAIVQKMGASDPNYYLIKEVKLNDKASIKARALAKLTSEEKKVLGL